MTSPQRARDARSLDAEVAEKVMGLEPPAGFERRNGQWEKDCEEVWVASRSITTWVETWPPAYSTDWSAMQAVVERMAARGGHLAVTVWPDGTVSVAFMGKPCGIYEGKASLPEAVALAALAACAGPDTE